MMNDTRILVDNFDDWCTGIINRLSEKFVNLEEITKSQEEK